MTFYDIDDGPSVTRIFLDTPMTIYVEILDCIIGSKISAIKPLIKLNYPPQWVVEASN